jgi:hypothetical protein
VPLTARTVLLLVSVCTCLDSSRDVHVLAYLIWPSAVVIALASLGDLASFPSDTHITAT